MTIAAPSANQYSLFEGPLRLIVGYKYLLATALMILTFSWVVASGDNILYGIVQNTIREDLIAQSPDPTA